MCISGNTGEAEPAFIVIGTDTTAEFGWEVSPWFLEKWHIILDTNILMYTNFWRKQRGLHALVWPGRQR
ncbi:hypothetical protein IE81DRAFT_324406 [Ceraceosorus guamensis]|nr:hypothetical protein IE81DRAFT_324406 [Ceraceosorus guamensis]PWN41547.1 hypothetical protein IE81DRAFT_324406 [Ceraceosorus guamensis]